MMKKIQKYTWIMFDVVMLLIFSIATIYSFITNDDAKFIFLIIVVYIITVVIRLSFSLTHLMNQDQDIKKLNERIHEKDDFIVELIKKYGNPKEGAEFLKELKNKLNLDE